MLFAVYRFSAIRFAALTAPCALPATSDRQVHGINPMTRVIKAPRSRAAPQLSDFIEA